MRTSEASAVQTTDGTVAYPTAFVTDVNIAESILAAYGITSRPFVVPQGVAFNPLAVGDYLTNEIRHSFDVHKSPRAGQADFGQRSRGPWVAWLEIGAFRQRLECGAT
jgi:hypothetical protein